MMDCKAFALLLDTPWEKLTQAQRDEMEQHAAQCPDCALALQIQRDMQGMDADETVPEAFSQGWRTMIREEERRMNEQNEKRRFPWKRALATAAAVIFVAGGTAISTLNGWGMESGKPAAQYRMADEPNYQYNDSRAQDYDYARQRVRSCLGYATAASFVMSVLLYALSGPIFSIFTDYPEILALGKQIMLVEIVLEFGRAVNNVMIRSLQVSGDVRFPTFLAITCQWSVAFGLSCLFAFGFGWGLIGVWLAMAADECIRAFVLMWRWHTGAWQRMGFAAHA